MEAVGYDDLLESFKNLGVGSGDVVFVQSALRLFGNVEGGAQTVARALFGVVGLEGTVVAPAFSFIHEIQENPIIDPTADKSEMGAISEAIRNLPGARRSVAYRHSFSAVGKNASTVTDVDHSLPVFHMQNSFGRLYALNAKVMLAGVTYYNSTSHHFGEFLLQVQYRQILHMPVRLKMPDGSVIDAVMADYYPKSEEPGKKTLPRDFNKYGRMLEKEGKVAIGSAGNAMIRVFYLRELIHLILRSYPLDDLGFHKREEDQFVALPDGAEVRGMVTNSHGAEEEAIWACVDPEKIHGRHSV